MTKLLTDQVSIVLDAVTALGSEGHSFDRPCGAQSVARSLMQRTGAPELSVTGRSKDAAAPRFAACQRCSSHRGRASPTG
jgi:hypothetical protein